MNQDIQFNSNNNNNNWINNNYISQNHHQNQQNPLESITHHQNQLNIQQQQQYQILQQQYNSQNNYTTYYNQLNNNNHYNSNQNNLNFNYNHNNNFLLYDPNLSFSTMPNNNNTTYFIDNSNNLQLHQPMNNNIYTNNSYPSVMEAHNKMEKQILSHQQQQQQLQQQNHQQQQQTQIQELYSNNKNHYSINTNNSNVDCKNKTTTKEGNSGYIYNNNNSTTTTISHSIYNSNQTSMQMAQEIPIGQRQLQYQLLQKQNQQNQHNNNINNNINNNNKQTTVVNQKKLQPVNNDKEDQQHVKKSQHQIQQQQQQVLIQQHQQHSSIIAASSSTTNSIIIEKDLIDKTLEQQQLQLELKINKEERDKIQLQINQHKQNIENHERIHKKPYLITSKVNEFFPKVLSLENWNFVGESTSRIYQTLNQRADFHKKSSACRVLLVKKIFSWLISHDKEYIKSHKTVDLVIAISDIINMIISLIELHRAPSNSILYLIIYSSDRFVERTGINHHQIFNLLLTSAIVNLKFWNESLYIQNKTIADIFSFSVKDLNTMERRFLYGLDYNLCVTEDELNKFIEKLKRLTISQSNLIK